MKMTPANREKLNWIKGVIVGIAACVGEDDKAIRDALRSLGRVVESML